MGYTSLHPYSRFKLETIWEFLNQKIQCTPKYNWLLIRLNTNKNLFSWFYTGPKEVSKFRHLRDLEKWGSSDPVSWLYVFSKASMLCSEQWYSCRMTNLVSNPPPQSSVYIPVYVKTDQQLPDLQKSIPIYWAKVKHTGICKWLGVIFNEKVLDPLALEGE